MADSNANLYEALFLMDQRAGLELQASLDKVREILERSDAEIIALNKWDERKLAYPIRGQKRGLYLLGLFRVDGRQIARIERDCHLSEAVLRLMVTRGEHLGEIEIQNAIDGVVFTETETALRDESGDGDADRESESVSADSND